MFCCSRFVPRGRSVYLGREQITNKADLGFAQDSLTSLYSTSWQMTEQSDKSDKEQSEICCMVNDGFVIEQNEPIASAAISEDHT